MTRNSCVVFDIPRDITLYICSQWLEVKHLGMLDCVVTQTKLRPIWLELLKCKGAFISRVYELQVIQWLCLRGINKINLIIERNHFDGLTLRYQLDFDSIREV